MRYWGVAYDRSMPRGVPRNIADENLTQAVKESGSWRGVLRALGYAATSGGLSAVLQQRAAELGLDTSHFRGQRTWSDDELAIAVRNSTNWSEVVDRMGLSISGLNLTAVKARAMRLRIDTGHLGRYGRVPAGEVPFVVKPDLLYLRRAAPALASAWFLHRGYTVSYPAEPCSYDLLVDCGQRIHRIQVKTATGKDRGSNAWVCRLMQKTAFVKREPYDPDSVDFFFIIDGDLAMFLVPIVEVAGQSAVNLPLPHRQVY
jgi:hypothetical protein